MTKTLKSFAKKQAANEKADGSTETTATETTGESTAETAEETTEEPESTETESTEQEAESTEQESSEEAEAESTETESTETSAQATALPAGYVGVNASDLEALRTKAGKWDAAEGEYNQLKTWYANTIQISAAAKEDATTQAQRQTANTIASQPWNKAAIDLADSM